LSDKTQKGPKPGNNKLQASPDLKIGQINSKLQYPNPPAADQTSIV